MSPEPNPRANLMLVDDTPENLKLLQIMLAKRNYRVRSFPRGRLALAAAAQEPPDLILLDISMPEMDGYEVCARLKADPALAPIPVIFISAMDEPLDKIKAFGCGGVDYVAKPFQVPEVLARVETHLKLRELQRTLEIQNRELQQNYDQLRELEGLRDKLVHMVVHDMRNPLTAMLLCCEAMLAEDSRPAEDLEALGAIGANARALEKFTQDMLFMSRLSHGKMVLNRVPVNLAELGQIVVENHRLQAQSRRIQLRLEGLSPGAPTLMLDHHLIQRAVENLVSNAIKYSPSNTTVTLRGEFAAGLNRLSVLDEGRGIPAEHRSRLFGQFATIELREQGITQTGLGLHFCFLVAEAHGGRVFMEPNQPRGSIFVLEL